MHSSVCAAHAAAAATHSPSERSSAQRAASAARAHLVVLGAPPAPVRRLGATHGGAAALLRPRTDAGWPRTRLWETAGNSNLNACQNRCFGGKIFTPELFRRLRLVGGLFRAQRFMHEGTGADTRLRPRCRQPLRQEGELRPGCQRICPFCAAVGPESSGLGLQRVPPHSCTTRIAVVSEALPRNAARSARHAAAKPGEGRPDRSAASLRGLAWPRERVPPLAARECEALEPLAAAEYFVICFKFAASRP